MGVRYANNSYRFDIGRRGVWRATKIKQDRVGNVEKEAYWGSQETLCYGRWSPGRGRMEEAHVAERVRQALWNVRSLLVCPIVVPGGATSEL